MLTQRRKRWANIKPTLVLYIVCYVIGIGCYLPFDCYHRFRVHTGSKHYFYFAVSFTKMCFRLNTSYFPFCKPFSFCLKHWLLKITSTIYCILITVLEHITPHRQSFFYIQLRRSTWYNTLIRVCFYIQIRRSTWNNTILRVCFYIKIRRSNWYNTIIRVCFYIQIRRSTWYNTIIRVCFYIQIRPSTWYNTIIRVCFYIKIRPSTCYEEIIRVCFILRLDLLLYIIQASHCVFLHPYKIFYINVVIR